MIKIGKKITSAVLVLCVLCSVFSVSTFAASDNAVDSGDYNADAVKLSFGYAHSAYITENGDLYTWGVNDVGRILRTFKIKKNVEVTDNGKIII